jgi:hypothetical protein
MRTSPLPHCVLHLQTDKPGHCPEHGMELKAVIYRCLSWSYVALKVEDCSFYKTRLQGI